MFESTRSMKPNSSTAIAKDDHSAKGERWSYKMKTFIMKWNDTVIFEEIFRCLWMHRPRELPYAAVAETE